MIKKNQFALIFLTIVTMIAVWYIKTPVEKPNDDELLTGGETTRLKEIMDMREVLRSERSIAVMGLNAIIADAEASLISKENALNEKNALSSLTEKEVLLELQVINKGYSDAFVHATSNGIEVLVISDDDSATNANEIILMTFSSFDDATSVIVEFKTVEDLKKP